MTPVTAVNTFRLRPGVGATDFDRFSRELDRPTCLRLGPVESFAVYLTDGPGTVDVVEVMTVTSWPDWERARDGAPEMKQVVERFEQLVDTGSVRTYLTHRSADEQGPLR
jgi:hypothetical protein